jgi:hypothetical protein
MRNELLGGFMKTVALVTFLFLSASSMVWAENASSSSAETCSKAIETAKAFKNQAEEEAYFAASNALNVCQVEAGQLGYASVAKRLDYDRHACNSPVHMLGYGVATPCLIEAAERASQLIQQK